MSVSYAFSLQAAVKAGPAPGGSREYDNSVEQVRDRVYKRNKAQKGAAWSRKPLNTRGFRLSQV